MKIVIIGMGNMGNIIYDQLDRLGQFDVVGCGRADDLNKKVADADIIIIAVKPQSTKELFENIKIDLSDKFIISIMAGITIDSLISLSGSKKVVRSMPNLGIKFGQGVIGWLASKDVNDGEKILIKKVFAVMGLEVEVETEEKIDQIAAISGSGPAYFFYLAELLAQKAVEFGFEKEIAEQIVRETLIGSAELLKNGDKSAEEWRTAVTSKGGTTEAAFRHLADNGFDKIFSDALDKAVEKAKELNK